LTEFQQILYTDITIITIIIINLLWRHSTGDQQRLTYTETYGKKINKKEKIDKRKRVLSIVNLKQ